MSSRGQHILSQITLIMDDLKGGSTKKDNVYVEMSLLEKIRVKDINQLMTKPSTLGKVQETYTFLKGSLVPRCCTDKASPGATVTADEERVAMNVKDLCIVFVFVLR